MKHLILNIIKLILILASTMAYAAVQSDITTDISSIMIIQDKKPSGKKAVKPAAREMVYQDGKLTTRITSKPLDKVMEEFSRLTGVKVVWQEQKIKKLISSGITNRSLDEAAQNILHGESYLLFYDSTEEGENLSRILILSRDGNSDAVIIDREINEDRASVFLLSENEIIEQIEDSEEPLFVLDEELEEEDLMLGLTPDSGP